MDVLKILFFLLKSSFIVHFIPLRRYHDRYFITSETNTVDLQPYIPKIRLLYRVISSLPIKVTCLIECMAIKNYLETFSVNQNIFIGIQTSDKLLAHAWCWQTQKNGYLELNS